MVDLLLLTIMATVVAGVILLIIEYRTGWFARSLLSSQRDNNLAQPAIGKSVTPNSYVKLYYKLVDAAASEPLSRLLPSTLALARKLGNRELEKWVRLELEGYYNTNPALTEDVEVPTYRTIVGQRSDEYGRPFVFKDLRFHFVNEDRLRNGVEELEHLATGEELISYRDPSTARVTLIREKLGVEAPIFTFNPYQIHGILSGIRARLVDWLTEIEPDVERPKDTSSYQDFQEKENRPQLGTRRVLGVAFFVISLITIVVFLVSSYVQPLLPPNTNDKVLLLVASFTGALAVLAALNDAIELFHKFFGERSDNRQSAPTSDNAELGEHSLCLYSHKNPPYNAVKMLYAGPEIAKDLDVKIVYKDSNGNEQTKVVTEFFPKEDPKMIWHYYKYDFLEPHQVVYFHLLKKTSTLDGKATVVVRFSGVRSGKPVQVRGEFDLEEY